MASKKKLNRIKKSKLSDKQIMKRKVRASAEWAELRHKLISKQKTDPITLKPLYRMANTHHLSQDDTYYSDLTEDRFIMLNSKSHELIHMVYDIRVREGDYNVFGRIQEIVDRMIELTEEDKNR